MKKIKVAFCVRDMKIGGVESVMIRTLDALLKTNLFDISVITYSKIKVPVYAQWFAAHPNVTVYTMYPSRWLGTDLARFFLLRIFQHLCRDVYRWWRRRKYGVRGASDIDLFIDYYNFSFDAEFRKLNKPKIVWWHSSIDAFVSGNYIRYMDDYDMLVTLTDGFVEEFRTRYPRYADKIMRIYNPISEKDIVAKSRAVSAPRGKYFCCVSRLYADKDIPTLLRGFDKFWGDNNRPDVKLYIIGDGSFRGRYEQMAASLPCANQVVFTGAVPNPLGYMRGAMANILSSYSEGFAIVLTEAAAVGTLNISSDCKNGPRDILLDGAGGLLFRPGDAAALAQHMSDVFNKRVDVAKMCRVARDGLARFDTDIITKQIIDLIKSYV